MFDVHPTVIKSAMPPGLAKAAPARIVLPSRRWMATIPVRRTPLP